MTAIGLALMAAGVTLVVAGITGRSLTELVNETLGAAKPSAAAATGAASVTVAPAGSAGSTQTRKE